MQFQQKSSFIQPDPTGVVGCSLYQSLPCPGARLLDPYVKHWSQAVAGEKGGV